MRDRDLPDGSVGGTVLHAVPAVLSAAALLALICWPLRQNLPAGSPLRQLLAGVLAVGACSAMLAVGLGAWIAVRLRTLLATLTAVAAAAIAVAWWLVVFAPQL